MLLFNQFVVQTLYLKYKKTPNSQLRAIIHSLKSKIMKSKIVGNYHIKNSRLQKINDSFELVIGTRKKPTITKPLNYLLICLPNNKFGYVSSMYLINRESHENAFKTYSIEVDSIEYQLSIDMGKKQAKIEYLNIEKKHNLITSQANF